MDKSANPSSSHDVLARALTQIKQLRAEVNQLTSAQHEPIAIVGIGCRFPGGIESPDQLRSELRKGFDAVGDIPRDRWDLTDFFDADADALGKMYTRQGAFLDSIDEFDAGFFGISPREATSMDPQQRLFLEVTYEALERAGVNISELEGSDAGVFAGVAALDYGSQQFQYRSLESLDPYFMSGNLASFIAGRVAYTFGLQGPALSIDTACSSSLVAVHLAISSLRSRETNLAIAGGVSIMLAPEWNIVLSRAKMMSPEGRCKTFDAGANGYVRGEGCGVVVLKRLSEAVRDGDPIEAIIRGTAMNQDGPASGITVPNGLAQQKVIRAALKDAGLRPPDVGYIEAHGTGTSLGDPIEVRSLGAVYATGRASDQPLWLGSIKTNMGHLEPAAGIAGLIKAVLGVRFGEIYPHLHLKTVNPEIDLASIPANISSSLQDWAEVADHPRRAGVSSFGASGTNAHLIIEQPPTTSMPAVGIDENKSLHSSSARKTAQLLVLSAKTAEARNALAAQYSDRLDGLDDKAWVEVCATTQRGRSLFSYRLAVVGSSAAEAQEELRNFATGSSSSRLSYGEARGVGPKVAMLFSGQGSQTIGMGLELYRRYPVFQEAFDRCEEILRSMLPRPLREVIEGKHGADLINQTAYTQPALYVVEYALAELWQSWGVTPVAVLGHSVGEYVAATIAGVFELETGLRLITTRAKMMQELPGEGGMISLLATEAQAKEIVQQFPQSISIAAVNGPASVVVSGLRSDLNKLRVTAEGAGIKTKELSVSHGFHSPQMDPMLEAFRSEVGRCKLSAPRLPLICNLYGALADERVQTADYWCRHVRESVRFSDGLDALVTLGVEVCVELGGHPVLMSMAKAQLPQQISVLPSLRKGRSDVEQMLGSLGELFTRGTKLCWDAVGEGPQTKARLPSYPFQRRRYWLPELEQRVGARPPRGASVQGGLSDLAHPLLDSRIPTPFAAGQFEVFLSLGRQSYLGDFIIEGVNVVNIGVYIEMIRAAADELQVDSRGISIDSLSIQRACVMSDEGINLQVILLSAPNGQYDFSVHSRSRGDIWTEHCNGRLRGLDVIPTSTTVSANHLITDMTGDEMYGSMQSRGIELGTAARWIKQIQSVEVEAVAQLRPAEPDDGGQGCTLHPGVIDALFQSAFAVLPAEADPEAAYMLVGASHVRLLPGSLPTQVHVVRRRWDAKTRSFTIDVQATDDSGTVIVDVEGAMLKHASRDLIQAQLQDRSEGERSEVEGTVAPTLRAMQEANDDAQRSAVLKLHLLDGVGKVLGAAGEDIDDRASLLELGLDSLMAVELKRVIEQRCGVLIPLVELLDGPSVSTLVSRVLPMMVALISENGGALSADVPEAMASIIPDPARRFEPFSLTDLQQAYLIGRGSDFSLGNVSTYFFIEVEVEGVELTRLEKAWNQLVERHDMLRAVFTEDGRQRVLPKVPDYKILTQDIRGLSDVDREQALVKYADEVRGQVFDTARWPMFEIRASRIDDQTMRLHLGFDALIMDAWSTSMIFGEWAAFYRSRSLPPISLRFCDYMNAIDEIRASDAYAHDLAYWEERVAMMPPAPELPLSKSPEKLERPEFSHRFARLSPEAWAKFQQHARRAKVTPSVALCCAYAEIIATWSRSRHFTLNLLFFNRLPLHADVKNVAANFSSTTLLEIDLRGSDDFTKVVQRVQRQLAQDLDHGLVTGVEVLRRINRRRGGTAGASMPVVFASTINLRAQDQGDSSFGLTSHLVSMGDGGREIGSSIRTPQVWLDHQVVEEDGYLTFNWDVVEELFPSQMIDAMFDRYTSLLQRLSDDPEAWSQNIHRAPLSEDLLHARHLRNMTATESKDRPLHEGFVAHAIRCPQAPAVITRSVRLTYGELDQRSEALAKKLLGQGVGPTNLVAVIMNKGWEQIVAVMAIYKAGAAYLPIDPSLPQERIQHLIEHAGACGVITQPAIDESLDLPSAIPRVYVERSDVLTKIDSTQRILRSVDPHSLAYVIYTSGSTGLPKGVAISHAAAWNTILDINRRFNIGSSDRTFGVSSLSFDLSVYDIFGPLNVGGAVVIPEDDQSRDPGAWVELASSEGVTVWNSVPALVQMLVEQITNVGGELGLLRLVLMSGDWIPVALPDAIRSISNGVQVVSLGGATEAAIWSIIYPIEAVPKSWTSIPYGHPLSNQRFHVLDDDLECRPPWTPGELYIAGDGLALGYWHDSERSDASFFCHPRTGERLYRTGDIGRYLDDGNIEFLGREDNQVKVNGYRIELGEIEAALERIDGLKSGVATVWGERASSKTLVGYLVFQDGVNLDTETVRSQLEKLIPFYMMPSAFVVLDKLPLTPNGKINRKALPSPQDRANLATRQHVSARDEGEQALTEIWRELLDLPEVGVTDDFFELGGQSFLAMRMMAQIRRRFGAKLPLSTLLEHSTIEGLAKRLSTSETATPWSPVVEISRGKKPPLILVHPVGGNVLCYTELARSVGSREVVGLQAIGLEEGQTPLPSIEAMAQAYLRALQARGIQGPFVLGGWSLGGVVAYEMARQLEASGTSVESVLMIDSRLEVDNCDKGEWERFSNFLLDLARVGGRSFSLSKERHQVEGRPHLGVVLQDAHEAKIIPEDMELGAFKRLWLVYGAGIEALAKYEPAPIKAPLYELVAADEAARLVRHRWTSREKKHHTRRVLAGDHYSLLLAPHRDALVKAMVEVLEHRSVG